MRIDKDDLFTIAGSVLCFMLALVMVALFLNLIGVLHNVK
jgi:hypothetical protein